MVILELIKNRVLASKAIFCRAFWQLPLKTRLKLLKMGMWEKPLSAGENLFISTFAPPVNNKPLYARYLDWIEQFFEKNYTPRYLNICITNKCFYNCEHCSNKNAKTGKEISSKEIKKVYEFFKNKGIFKVIFTGGEPLVHPKLISIIDSLDKNLVYPAICTSGYGLSAQKAQELKKAGLAIVKIGLDSNNEEKNDHYKNFKGAFSNSLKAIKNAKSEGLCIVVQTVLDPELVQSEQKFFGFIDFLEKLGVQEVEFLEPKPCGKYYLTDKLLKPEDKKKFSKLARKVNWSLRKIKCTSYFEFEDKMGCSGGVCSFYLDAVGNLMPCAFAQVSFGNIREESLEEIYKRFQSVLPQPGKTCLSFEIAQKRRAGLKIDYSLFVRNNKK